MPESEEEKKRRWAAAAAKSYMTPSMAHALSMSKQQSVNKYKEKHDKTKAKGYTSVATTPAIENAKKQSTIISQNIYKSDFEKSKAKFTQVADDPETLRAIRVANQISNISYHGKGSAVSKYRRRKNIQPETSSSTKTTEEVSQSDIPAEDEASETSHDLEHEHEHMENEREEMSNRNDASGSDVEIENTDVVSEEAIHEFNNNTETDVIDNKYTEVGQTNDEELYKPQENYMPENEASNESLIDNNETNISHEALTDEHEVMQGYEPGDFQHESAHQEEVNIDISGNHDEEIIPEHSDIATDNSLDDFYASLA